LYVYPADGAYTVTMLAASGFGSTLSVVLFMPTSLDVLPSTFTVTLYSPASLTLSGLFVPVATATELPTLV